MAGIITAECGVNEIQYVLNHPAQIINASQIDTEELSDIMYADGTQAIYLNGHIVSEEGQTLVLQEDEDINQFCVNDNGEILLTEDNILQTTSTNQTYEDTEVIQLVDEEENLTDEISHIVFVNENGLPFNDDLSQYHLTSDLQTEAIELGTEVVGLEELIKQQTEEGEAVLENFTNENRYQYAILKDGQLHIQSYSSEELPLASNIDILGVSKDSSCLTNEQILDLSNITGRNLITGQTVTLHNYIDKLQKRIKEPTGRPSRPTSNKRKVNNGLDSLLNKKLNLGKISNGKKLFGKIVQIKNKTESEAAQKNLEVQDIKIEKYADVDFNATSELIPVKESLESSTSANGGKYIIQRKLISKQCFRHISKTLGGLMNMDSVRRKLQNKHILVKVVEKKIGPSKKAFSKSVSYSSGYMESSIIANEQGSLIYHWTFVPDLNVKKTLLDEIGVQEAPRRKFPGLAYLTLLITYQKNTERIRVILDPSNVNKCYECLKTFRTKLQLRVHLNTVHHINGVPKLCEICGFTYNTQNELEDHKKFHEGQKLFCCTVENCSMYFSTLKKLKRHSLSHSANFKLLECLVCYHRCSSESTLRRHLTTHMNIKPFVCDVCGKCFANLGDLNFHKRIHDPLNYYTCNICKRKFSRHSNLQRHIDIHKGKGELFRCSICGCSYHYISSLTRHVVQNHIAKMPNVNE